MQYNHNALAIRPSAIYAMRYGPGRKRQQRKVRRNAIGFTSSVPLQAAVCRVWKLIAGGEGRSGRHVMVSEGVQCNGFTAQQVARLCLSLSLFQFLFLCYYNVLEKKE